MDTHKLYAWLVSVLEDEGSIDQKSLVGKVEAEDLDHILFLLNYMVSKGYVKAEVTGNDTRYFPQNIVEIKKTLEHASPSVSEFPQQQIQNSLVVSVPISLIEDFERLKKKYQLPILFLKDAIKLLLCSAKEEVLIASPFIEWDGMVYISDDIAKAAKNGASIKLITRDVLDAKDGYSHVEKIKTISKMLNIYEMSKSKPDKTFSVKDYGQQISGLGRTTMHYEGMHQKMVVVDRKYAYVGSGEIRAASLVTNGEGGHLVIGAEAAFWADFLGLFWKSGREIPREYLK